MRVLIIAAHPDDEVLGCGGTIANLTDSGHYVYVGILGTGIAARYEDHTIEVTDQILSLKKNLHEAANILGVTDVFTYNLSDNQFDLEGFLKIVTIIEGLINRIEPSVIYTHHAGDLNIDHELTAKAVITATRPQSGNLVEKIYSFEVLSSTEWAFNSKRAFCPNVYVNIENYLSQKLEAVSKYKDELRQFPHPRSLGGIKTLAAYRGQTVGLSYAEAFEIIREIV